MGGVGVVIHIIDLFEGLDALQNILIERWGFALQGVKHKAFQEITQRDIEVFGQTFEHFEHAFFEAHTGLHAFDTDFFGGRREIFTHVILLPTYQDMRIISGLGELSRVSLPVVTGMIYNLVGSEGKITRNEKSHFALKVYAEL
jgi:hypothetical protein